MGVGASGRPGDEATHEPGPDLADPPLLRLGGGAPTRNGFGHPIGQGGDETRSLLRRQPKRPGADVSLPQGDHHGGIRLVCGDPHPSEGTTGVKEPGSFTVQMALDRHGPSMAPGTISGYWCFQPDQSPGPRGRCRHDPAPTSEPDGEVPECPARRGARADWSPRAHNRIDRRRLAASASSTSPPSSSASARGWATGWSTSSCPTPPPASP